MGLISAARAAMSQSAIPAGRGLRPASPGIAMSSGAVARGWHTQLAFLLSDHRSPCCKPFSCNGLRVSQKLLAKVGGKRRELQWTSCRLMPFAAAPCIAIVLSQRESAPVMKKKPHAIPRRRWLADAARPTAASLAIASALTVAGSTPAEAGQARTAFKNASPLARDPKAEVKNGGKIKRQKGGPIIETFLPNAHFQ